MRYVPKEDDELTPAEIAERERQMTSFVKSKADELATTAADHAAPIKSLSEHEGDTGDLLSAMERALGSDSERA